ncbi:MAG: Xanthine phosphoribosyltransferase [Firmicutes bacterium ADurb.Bin506]|nr:MAG: Xanthine phosphoribosyltransferase [Firmicutes bacterium ADurb.Bin506]
MTWKDIERLVDVIYSRIDGDFDAILCITRGGMVPAALLAERIGQRNVMSAAVMFYTGDGVTLDKPVFLQFPPDPQLAGKRVLVVDDVWDSGRTIVAVCDRIRMVGGIPVTAVLHYKPTHSAFPDLHPDHHGAQMDGWIQYPWDPLSLEKNVAEASGE